MYLSLKNTSYFTLFISKLLIKLMIQTTTCKWGDIIFYKTEKSKRTNNRFNSYQYGIYREYVEHDRIRWHLEKYQNDTIDKNDVNNWWCVRR